MAHPGLLRRAPVSDRRATGKLRHGHRERRDPPHLPEVAAAAALAWTAPGTAARAMPLASSRDRCSGTWARRQGWRPPACTACQAAPARPGLREQPPPDSAPHAGGARGRPIACLFPGA